MQPILIKALVISGLIVLAYYYSPKIDQSSYNNAVTLKNETILLMQKAGEDFDKHQKEIKKLKLKLVYAYKLQKSKGDGNTRVLNLWSDLINNDELLGGFFKTWERQTVLEDCLIKEQMAQVEDIYDNIITIENKELKETIQAYY